MSMSADPPAAQYLACGSVRRGLRGARRYRTARGAPGVVVAGVAAGSVVLRIARNDSRAATTAAGMSDPPDTSFHYSRSLVHLATD
ncbi:hypothetical protein I546_0902 [Mycobacterium kansasii 732]|nr:hypothetical protein I546_0902 [Mycobacterium kansasii 732]